MSQKLNPEQRIGHRPPIIDLGLGAESASQIAEGLGEGLGGVFFLAKLAYDAGTYLYGVGHCYW
jgi:hypothetical protein